MCARHCAGYSKLAEFCLGGSYSLVEETSIKEMINCYCCSCAGSCWGAQTD